MASGAAARHRAGTHSYDGPGDGYSVSSAKDRQYNHGGPGGVAHQVGGGSGRRIQQRPRRIRVHCARYLHRGHRRRGHAALALAVAYLGILRQGGHREHFPNYTYGICPWPYCLSLALEPRVPAHTPSVALDDDRRPPAAPPGWQWSPDSSPLVVPPELRERLIPVRRWSRARSNGHWIRVRWRPRWSPNGRRTSMSQWLHSLAHRKLPLLSKFHRRWNLLG